MGNQALPRYFAGQDAAFIIDADNRRSQVAAERIRDHGAYTIPPDSGKAVCRSQIDSDNCHTKTSVIISMRVIARCEVCY
jgi:hypothetical protein